MKKNILSTTLFTMALIAMIGLSHLANIGFMAKKGGRALGAASQRAFYRRTDGVYVDGWSYRNGEVVLFTKQIHTENLYVSEEGMEADGPYWWNRFRNYAYFVPFDRGTDRLEDCQEEMEQYGFCVLSINTLGIEIFGEKYKYNLNYEEWLGKFNDAKLFGQKKAHYHADRPGVRRPFAVQTQSLLHTDE